MRTPFCFRVLLAALILPAAGWAQSSPTVPKIILTTENRAPVTKSKAVPGSVTIDPRGLNPEWALSLPAELKGRGNLSWKQPKKPFKIKFESAVPVMGLPADREWVLIANYLDKTLMRNLLGNELSRRLELAYTPRTRVVEVQLNGRNLGTYVWTEQVKVSADRVNAPVTADEAGFLIEMDRRKDSKFQFITGWSEPYAIRAPSKPDAAQTAFIRDYVQKAEDALHAANFADPLNGYAKYIDVASFIDWYLVNEIMKNSDAGNFSSIFFYKPAGEKMKMGPVWDFDIGAGNTDWNETLPTEGWWIRRRSPWFSRLFRDRAFECRVAARWRDMKPRGLTAASLSAFIDRTAFELDLTQKNNFRIWPILDKIVWTTRAQPGSYKGEVAFLKSWLNARVRWMDEQYGRRIETCGAQK